MGLVKYDTIPRDMLRPALCFLEPGESAWVPHAAIIVDAAGRAHVDLQCSILSWAGHASAPVLQSNILGPGECPPSEDAVRVRRGDSGWVLEISCYREFYVSAREYSEMSDARVVEVRVETYGTHGTRPAGT